MKGAAMLKVVSRDTFIDVGRQHLSGIESVFVEGTTINVVQYPNPDQEGRVIAQAIYMTDPGTREVRVRYEVDSALLSPQLVT
jgi:hypothetical protein